MFETFERLRCEKKDHPREQALLEFKDPAIFRAVREYTREVCSSSSKEYPKAVAGPAACSKPYATSMFVVVVIIRCSGSTSS